MAVLFKLLLILLISGLELIGYIFYLNLGVEKLFLTCFVTWIFVTLFFIHFHELFCPSFAQSHWMFQENRANRKLMERGKSWCQFEKTELISKEYSAILI